ncbi:uncharacterized protein BDR25DRAFT_371972 [Lindgomyces ingoldianus]|uniref:Uncharacterized protein n=1 Tax=Lindgomyces ingoldianus TaxID=673940 RepID=A0ACB6QTC2_9PLEO|nr:uncharacterized protein BDR25DRAFT_371972 [Lindgomyces ingoldianus]KAF2469416.1 hypothetical protein BDR25DRAFT_371972 [Lindgomyces ingoldianus]
MSGGVVRINPETATQRTPNLSESAPARGPASAGIAIVRNKRPDPSAVQLKVALTKSGGTAHSEVTLRMILQGISSSILYTVGLAVLVDTIEKDEAGQWMGTAMSCNNIGIIISPLLGGIIYDRSGKMSVFLIMIGLGAFDIVLRVLMKERTRIFAEAANKDNPCAKELGNHRLDSTISVTPSIISSNLGPVLVTKSQSHRRLPGIISLLRSPRLLAALYGCFINECIVLPT